MSAPSATAKNFSFPAVSLFFIWGASFLFALMPLEAYDKHSFLFSFVLLSLGTGVAALALPRDRSLCLPRAPVLFLLGGFWLTALVAVLMSDILTVSYIHFCFLSTLPLVFIMVSLAPEDFYKRAISFTGIIFFVLALTTLAQYFFFPELLSSHLTHLPMANPNSLAGFLSLGFFGVYGFLLTRQKESEKWICWVFALLLFGAVLTTGSRGAFLALLFGMALFTAFAWRWFVKDKFLHIAFLVAAVLMFFFLTQVTHENNNQTPGAVLVNSISGEMPAFGARGEIWRSTWRIIQDHFWVGTGPGTFVHYYPEYRGADYETAGHMAHNDPLQFWAEMGVFAPLFFYAFLIFAALRTWRALCALAPGNPRRIIILAPFCAFAAMVLHTHISFHFYVLPTLFLTGSWLAHWFSETQKAVSVKSFKLVSGEIWEADILKLSFCILLICTNFLFVSFLGSDIMAQQAKKKYFAGNIAGFATQINNAVTLSLEKNGLAQALAGTVPARQLKSGGFPLQQKKKFFAQADRLFDQAVANNPRLASAYHEKALLHEYAAENRGIAQPEDTEALLRTALKLNPLHANTRLKLAQTVFLKGNREEALDILKAGFEWNYRNQNPLPYFDFAAKTARLLGDEKAAEKAQQKYNQYYDRVQSRIEKARISRTEGGS